MIAPEESHPIDTSQPLLVGRTREQARLREHLAGALAGHGRLILISGEAGIGKTALARALGREASAHCALVLTGHCYDLTETPPYGPWAEILAHRDVFLNCPSLPPHADPAALAANQVALFAQVRACVAAAASRTPLVLLLEDLHWTDFDSLDLLRFLARSAADLPLLLVVTYRADELTRRHPLYTLLPLLVREADAERLDLRRLDPDAVRTLVAARYALPAAEQEELVSYLQDHAEGNPLYIGELLRTFEEERLLTLAESGWTLGDLTQAHVPPLLRQVIQGRLLRLGEDAHALLSIAAVIGQDVPLGLWRTVGGVSEEALLGVVEAAVEARLLEAPADGATVAFTHGLIREVLYDGLLPPRRRVWHRHVAEALLATAAAPSDLDPDPIAYHLQRAGDPRAANWLIRAGERAQRGYGLLTAAERFEAALQILEVQGAPPVERAGLLYRLARMRRYADPRLALAYLDDAAALADEGSDRVLATYIGCFRGGLRCSAGEIRAGLEDLASGIAAIDALGADERRRLRTLQEDLGDPPDEYHYRGALVSWMAIAGRASGALAFEERIGSEPPKPGIGTSGYANAWRGVASAQAVMGRPEQARRAYARSVAAYRTVEHHYQIGNALLLELYEVLLPYYADDLVERRRWVEAGEEAWARASGALADLPPRFAWLPLLVLEGAWAEARHLALTVSRPAGRTTWRPFARVMLALLSREQGHPDRAAHLVQEQIPAGPAAEPGDAILLDTLPLQRLATALALDAGDLPAARAWLDAHDRWLNWSGAVLGRAEGHLGWAAYHRAAREPGPARRQAEQALATAGDPRQPLALLAAHRLLGEIDTDARRHNDAARHLDEALALAEACAAPYERALTLLALARLRGLTGHGDEARALLDVVRDLCAPMGAGLLLARLEAFAVRLAPPRPTTPRYPNGLTAREVEILRHVAEGLTDAQVAERLFLSPRTVSQHLRSIYNKLGVSSRAAATRFAVEHHLW